MNDHLKFSFGHILAFVAIIAISYLTFAGTCYYTGSNFAKAGVTTAIVVILLVAVFVGAQFLKAHDRKFARNIKIERTLIYASPVVLILTLLPASHFWTVNQRNKQIVEDFRNSIQASLRLFDDYDSYAKKRIRTYESTLRADTKITNIQRKNMQQTLDLQLCSENYTRLKDQATKWIKEANQGATTLNVFLVGNTKGISTAIHQWGDQLDTFSKPTLSNESENTKNFTQAAKTLTKVDDGFKQMQDSFTTTAFPNVFAIITMLLAYGMLILPYLIQDRHTKSTYRLVGREQRHSNAGIHIDADDDDDYTPTTATSTKPSTTKPSGGYSAFTIK